MNLIKYIYRQSKLLFLLSIVASLISGFVGAALIGIISKKVEGNIDSTNLGWMFFIGCLIFFVSKTLSALALLNLTQSAILSLRINLSKRVLSTPIKKLQELGRHGLFAVLTKDVETFSQLFMLIPMVFGNAILIVVCFAYLAWVSFNSFLILASLIILSALGFYFLERRPLVLMEELRNRLDRLYQNFQSLISGSKELQLNRQKGSLFINDVLSPEASDFKKHSVKSYVGYTYLANIGSVIFYLIIGVMIFIIPLWFSLSPGILITTSLIVLFLVGPISELMGHLPILRQSGISLRKIEQLDSDLNSFSSNYLDAVNPFINVRSVSLEFENIVYRYGDDSEDNYFVLGPLNLKVGQGEIVFIIGGNGSGKTTLAMLLVGLFKPDSGSIRCNGMEVTPANEEHYRQIFSAVFSDFHLFEELLSGEKNAAEQANYYIHALNMEHKVKIVNDKFSTIGLSTGQRKRLALVSAYLEDRQVYLFDEWASDQDPVFKKVFYTELLPELKSQGKTIIVITHDDGYFDYCDRRIVLEEGHLKEK